jgi:hypothetical protein
LTFGDKVESPDATKLPVNLAIALLKNNRGEIDLNLPISGSLDDPHFSVGGLIIKVIVNLFVKAVTSPFALLGSMFGGGEELVEYRIRTRAAPVLASGDQAPGVAGQGAHERDSLKLEITGRADPEVDKEGLKRVAMERAVKGEKLKEQIKKGDRRRNPSIRSRSTRHEYPEYLKRAYKEAKFPKPRNVIGMQKDLPVEEMEKLMLTNLPASDDERSGTRPAAGGECSGLVDRAGQGSGRTHLSGAAQARCGRQGQRQPRRLLAALGNERNRVSGPAGGARRHRSVAGHRVAAR